MTNFFNNIKYFIQRGKRGYADCDLWDFDVYLAKTLTNALKDFKKINQGIAPNIYRKYINRKDLTQKQKDELAKKEWNTILDIMIRGFSIVPKLFEGKVLNNKILKEGYMYELGIAFDFLKKYYFDLWD